MRLKKSQIIKELCSFLSFLFFKKCDYLFFTASRNKINETKVFDQNLGDVLNTISGKYFAFENFERDKTKWYYDNTLFDPIFIFRKVFNFFFKTQDYSDLVSLITSEHENSKIGNEEINNIVIDFKIDYAFYYFILKWKKVKAVFITQNGIQKGLFAAAKKCNIPVIEVQHGIIDEGHLAYNYNKTISYDDHRIYMPTYYFSFSDFWIEKLNIPVKKIFSMGNSFFYNDQDTKIALKDSSAQGLLVASSDVFGENLKNLVLEFANRRNETKVYFKLHPNQFSEKQYYVDQFANFENVKVYTNEKSLYELLEISKAILLIQSTALYEAYHLKIRGIIYKKQTYTRHSHVFELPNISLVDNVDELVKAFETEFVDDVLKKDLFFKKFDTAQFTQFMNKIGIN
ncbi:capsular polysaccharide export protein, LipB/KpsS family [Flavobacterium sp. WC2509]|uniref:capsular polysaccharide export protein, LipB/KpsS family n=1 Tax=Flavobacterium sp. WC2509 TaxID=3461406 RepID=UPI004044056D